MGDLLNNWIPLMEAAGIPKDRFEEISKCLENIYYIEKYFSGNSKELPSNSSLLIANLKIIESLDISNIKFIDEPKYELNKKKGKIIGDFSFEYLLNSDDSLKIRENDPYPIIIGLSIKKVSSEIKKMIDMGYQTIIYMPLESVKIIMEGSNCPKLIIKSRISFIGNENGIYQQDEVKDTLPTDQIKESRKFLREIFKLDPDFKRTYIDNVSMHLYDHAGLTEKSTRDELAEGIIDLIFSP